MTLATSRFIQKFYFDQDTHKIDIRNYGKYRLGLMNDEVADYLHMRAIQCKPENACLDFGPQTKLLSKKQVARLANKFYEIAGANTCAVIDGISLMYHHDVERYSDLLFNGTATYWD